MRGAAFIAVALVAWGPASSWAQGTGAEAFAANDMATAQALWQQEASAGSAEAMLGLGLLADRGFGGARDPAAAFDWYAQAAARGLAEAQFNLAVIHDAGVGQPRDVAQAVLWYTRAALRDHARAQYNLGLFYESGDGITANTALAQYWFDKAASTVPAAAGKTYAPLTGAGLTAPAILFASGTELVWTLDAATSTVFLVEAVQAPAKGQDYAPPVLSQVTTASGLVTDAPAQSDTLWRVSSIAADGTDYAASGWISAQGSASSAGRVTMIADPASPAMVQAAAIFAADLRHAGFWVRLDQRAPQQTDAFISFGYAADQQLAERLASYLPGLTEPTPVKQSLNTTAPGEIIVNLAAFR